MRKAIVAGLLAAIVATGNAFAGHIVNSNLYPDSLPINEGRMEPGETRFVFFRALADLRILAMSAFGEPIAPNAAADMRWQLFEVGPDWIPPNGNADRLFYAVEFLNGDSGEKIYTQEVSSDLDIFRTNLLEKNHYYYLSFQITNMFWETQFFFAGSENFVTADGLLEVAGHTTNPTGPAGVSIALPFSLRLEAIPEPASHTLVLAVILMTSVMGWHRHKTSSRSRSV